MILYNEGQRNRNAVVITSNLISIYIVLQSIQKYYHYAYKSSQNEIYQLISIFDF